MQSIKQIQRLNQRELEASVPASASWHTDYRDTAYIYIGGLPLELSEGDVVTIFSQFGDPVWVRLARDKDTGKSRGFAWLKYEDQKSCDLAVDNLSGASVMGRLLAVDHTRYQKRKDEDATDGYVGQDRQIEPEQGRSGKRRRTNEPISESEDEEEQRPMIKEEIELARMQKEQDVEDPMTAYLIEQKKDEVERALKSLVKTGGKDGDRKHRHHRSRTDRSDDGAERERRHRRRRSRSREEGVRHDRHRSRRDRSTDDDRPRSRSPRPRR